MLLFDLFLYPTALCCFLPIVLFHFSTTGFIDITLKTLLSYVRVFIKWLCHYVVQCYINPNK